MEKYTQKYMSQKIKISTSICPPNPHFWFLGKYSKFWAFLLMRSQPFLFFCSPSIECASSSIVVLLCFCDEKRPKRDRQEMAFGSEGLRRPERSRGRGEKRPEIEMLMLCTGKYSTSTSWSGKKGHARPLERGATGKNEGLSL